MGIAERKARQKSSLRTEILDHARRIFAEEGYDQLSMRRLAERIEYSPTTIYLYFKDKDALFQAICDETFARLVQRLEKQKQRHPGDPLGALKAGLREYIDFGLKHPEHYIVTFMKRPAAAAEVQFDGSAGERAFGVLRQAVQDCIDANLLRPIHTDLASQVLWVGIHGLVSLLVAKKEFPFAQRAVLVEELLDTLLRGVAKA